MPHSNPIFKGLKILKIDEKFQLQLTRFISPPLFHSWLILVSGIRENATRLIAVAQWLGASNIFRQIC